MVLKLKIYKGKIKITWDKKLTTTYRSTYKYIIFPKGKSWENFPFVDLFFNSYNLFSWWWMDILGENGCLLLLDGSDNNYFKFLPPIFEQLKKNVHVCFMCVKMIF